jgi:hypothetical protein
MDGQQAIWYLQQDDALEHLIFLKLLPFEFKPNQNLN